MLSSLLTTIGNLVTSNNQPQTTESNVMSAVANFEQLDLSSVKRHRTVRNNPNDRWNKIYNTVRNRAAELPLANENEPDYGFFVPFPKDVVEKSASVYKEIKRKNSLKLSNTTVKVKSILKEVSASSSENPTFGVKRLNHPEQGVGLWIYRTRG